MSSPLEKFILENRQEFDTDLPDLRVWEKINEKMAPVIPGSAKAAPVRSLHVKRWLAAAAAAAVVGLASLLYFTLNKAKQPDAIAGKTTQPVNGDNNLPKPDTSSNIAKTNPEVVAPAIQNGQNPLVSNPGDSKTSGIGDNKEMYYYAKLIELKHEELKTLEKDEPLLYRQFSGDVQKLDSVYHSLKTQLPKNSNREQVIEAMISNLQLQIGLLNKQLDIIKQIKHSKKSAYEKAFKSV